MIQNFQELQLEKEIQVLLLKILFVIFVQKMATEQQLLQFTIEH